MLTVTPWQQTVRQAAIQTHVHFPFMQQSDISPPRALLQQHSTSIWSCCGSQLSIVPKSTSCNLINHQDYQPCRHHKTIRSCQGRSKFASYDRRSILAHQILIPATQTLSAYTSPTTRKNSRSTSSHGHSFEPPLFSVPNSTPT